jgi:outer membrane lipoprotein-sorting protein
MNNLTAKTHKFRNQSFVNLIILLLIIFRINFVFASTEDQIIENIKSSIQNIQSVAISFGQSDSKGTKATGVLVINKPHKFRVNYFKPFPLLIVGNKSYVSVYDDEMENLSRISAEENIFNFLLVDRINFDDQFEVISAKETTGHYQLKLNHLDSGKTSEIVFNKNTKNIEMMEIVEENNVIKLKFGATKKLSKINNKLFILQDPDIFGKPEYLDQEHLEKNYE